MHFNSHCAVYFRAKNCAPKKLPRFSVQKLLIKCSRDTGWMRTGVVENIQNCWKACKHVTVCTDQSIFKCWRWKKSVKERCHCCFRKHYAVHVQLKPDWNVITGYTIPAIFQASNALNRLNIKFLHYKNVAAH